jgi:hypothetical protein
MKRLAIGGDSEASVANVFNKNSLTVTTFQTLELFAEHYSCDGVLIAQSLMGVSGFIPNYGAWSNHSKHPAPMGYEHAAIIDRTQRDPDSIPLRFKGVRYVCAFKLSGEDPKDKWEDLFESCYRLKEDFCLGIFVPIGPFANSSREYSRAYFDALIVCNDLDIKPREIETVLGLL